ncbi:hypothetical protein PSV08DRAFT_377922 [Bipolaris maydis]|uniref:uncharacterized protein n=1 Tax=Cochliobolus heterostrophus TaxID=5016 RepID=UPI0024D49351|nr:hypothetical protein J3E73DRAFT_399398 [Bipolaris maydis]KAJ6269289.1 hypothetical protein PSV08DRAFT_377922 [Bipolaris maydis]
MQKRRMGGRRERGEGGGRERKRKREMEEERARWRNGGGGEEEKSDGHSERREKRERARRAVGTQQHGPRPSPQRAHRWTRRRVLTGSGPVIGSEAAVANGGHAKSRRYWPAPKATTAAPQPPSNPPSKYTCPAIHHCPLPTAHCPLPTPHSTSLASSACVSPPARVSPAHVARAPCTASADVPTRLPLRVHVPGSHSVRFCSCVANKPSLPHTGGPFLEPRGAQAGLKLSLRLNSPGPCTAPSSRHRLRCPADCRRTCQAPSHQNMLVLLCRRSILTLSSWLRRGWRPAGACAAFTRDNTCPTALVTRPSPVSPAGHRASSVR